MRFESSTKIIDKGDLFWEFSYFVDMTNRTDEEREYTVKIHFLDSDGFAVDFDFAGSAINEIPAQTTTRFLGQLLIDADIAPTVVDLQLEVSVW